VLCGGGIVAANGARSGSVIALINAVEVCDYPSEVIFNIRQNRLSDYRLAAEYIDLSGVNVVSLQHEFDIFGRPVDWSLLISSST
jgi:hypothetical protein